MDKKYYEEKIAETIKASKKTIETTQGLIVEMSDNASIGLGDGIADLSDLQGRIGSLGFDLKYYRNKLLDLRLKSEA